MEDTEENNNFDTDEFLDRNKEERDFRDVKRELTENKEPEETQKPEWLIEFRKTYDPEIRETQIANYNSEQAEKICRDTLLNDLEIEENYAELDLSRNSMTRKYLQRHHGADYKTNNYPDNPHRITRTCGYHIGRIIKETEKHLLEDHEIEEINLNKPSYLGKEKETVELEEGDEKPLLDSLIEFFAAETYRENFREYASSFEQEKEIIAEADLIAPKRIQDYDTETIDSSNAQEITKTTVKRYQEFQKMSPYAEGFIDGMIYAKDPTNF